MQLLDTIQQILWTLKWLGKTILDACTALFGWVWNWVWAYMQPAWQWVRDMLDALLQYLHFPDTTQFLDLYAGANLWLPLDEFFQILGAYSIFWVSVVFVRYVIKFIPTIGSS
ncbi:hypothetical protein Pan181_45660 [Aeoliella mucimassa]|uniref:Uncharacterized protein n=2 Tax=Aeoliella mucimassa TaxID=2527972 RepID=A0A518AUF1_9BACT|nr:hypothetical protein Pan181_45660 [Aeoliella mucimassa]